MFKHSGELFRDIGRGRILMQLVDGQWHSAWILGRKLSELTPHEGLDDTQTIPILVFADQSQIELFLSGTCPEHQSTREYMRTVLRLPGQMLVGTLQSWVDLVEPTIRSKEAPLSERVSQAETLMDAAKAVFSSDCNFHYASLLQEVRQFVAASSWKVNQLRNPLAVWKLHTNYAAHQRNIERVKKALSGEQQGQMVRFNAVSTHAVMVDEEFRGMISKNQYLCLRKPDGTLLRTRVHGWRLSSYNSPLAHADIVNSELEVHPLESVVHMHLPKERQATVKRGMPMDVMAAAGELAAATPTHSG